VPKPSYTAPIPFKPVHAAVLGYVEWCCDHRLRFPKVAVVAEDLARDRTSVMRAFVDLLDWGAFSMRFAYGQSKIIRLGDGRETAPPAIPALHRRIRRYRRARVVADRRIAA